MSSLDDAPAYSPLRRALIITTVTTATALYALTLTIVNVALPQIQGAFSVTQDQVAGVVTFNIVATAVGTPLTGWLTGRFGQRRVMLVSMFGFGAATVLCGLSDSLLELIVWRVAQGLFGAPLAPLSQAILLDSTPKEKQGGATAIFGMGVVLGPVIGPTAGGYLAEMYSWRWVFFLIVPVAIVCFAAIYAFIQDRHDRSEMRFDWTGFLALAIAIGCFQLMLDRGPRNDWFESIETMTEATLAATAFYVFIAHSLSSTTPFLNPRLLLNRNYTIGLLITTTFGMLNLTLMVLLPPLLQRLQGYPDSIIGLLLGARAVGTLLGFIIMKYGNRLDPRMWLVIGFALQGAAGLRLAQFNAEVSFYDVALALGIQGLGVGLLWVPITLVTFATVERRILPEGMAIFHLVRNIASSVHISLSVSMVVYFTSVNYAGLVEGISVFNEVARNPSTLGLWSLDSPSSVAALSGEILRQASMIGYLNAFYFYAGTALIVLPFIALVKKP
ncbi:MAG: DHA2 family multidrug resistance protein [Gammaproteobacteria bacterium]|jgi:DHA2 family multidrug resistance protein